MNLLRNNKGLLFLSFSILYYISIIFFIGVRFEDNDDYSMQLLAQGYFGGSPSIFIPFVNAIYGIILYLLYATGIEAPWYSILQGGIIVASMAVILHNLYTYHKGILRHVLALLFLFILVAQFAINLQFTTTSFLAGFAGYSLLLYEARNQQHIAWPQALLATVLAVFSLLLRSDMFFLCSIYFGIVAGLDFLKHKHTTLLRPFATILGMAAICFAVNFAVYYSQPAYFHYTKYDKIRGQLNDNPNLSDISDPCLNEVLWSRNDKAAFIHFMVNIPGSPMENFAKIKQCLPKALHVKEMASRVINLALGGKVFALACIVVACLVLAFGTANDRMMLVALVAGTLVLLVVISASGSLKHRVFQPMLLCTVAFVLPYCTFNRRQGKLPTILLGGLLLISLVIGFWNLSKNKTELGTKRTEALKALAFMRSQVPDGTVGLIWGGADPLRSINPFFDTPNNSFPNNMLLVNYTLNHPEVKAYSTSLGLNNFYKDLASRTHVWVVDEERATLYTAILTTLYQEHFGMTVKVQVTDKTQYQHIRNMATMQIIAAP